MRRFAVACVVLLAIMLLTLPCWGCCRSQEPQKYAVLISTEVAGSEGTRNNSEFWYDVVLTYCTLIKHDFKPENIFVLYGDGQPFMADQFTYYHSLNCGGTAGPGPSNAIVPLTNGGVVVKDNICNVLCCMAVGRPAVQPNGKCECSPVAPSDGFSCSGFPKLAAQDFLFIWLKGHGAANGSDVYLGLESGVTLTDGELERMMGKLAPRRRALVFETCAAGGWLDNFSNSQVDNFLRRGTVTLTASGKPNGAMRWDESSYPDSYPDEAGSGALVLHGRFTYWLNSALRRENLIGRVVDSDSDRNNLVSVLEAYDAANEKILQENEALSTSGSQMEQHPGINTRGGIAPCVFIGLGDPGWYCQCFRRIPGP